MGWSSLSVKAVITPGLCVHMILGTPFIKSNKLMIDLEHNAVIHKDSGINILDESPFELHCQPKEVSKE